MRVLSVVVVVGLVMGCGESHGARDAAADRDGATGLDGTTARDGGVDRDGAPGPDGRTCPALGCFPNCDFGIARDAFGCETCTCLPDPSGPCTGDEDCILAVDFSVCCGCREAVLASYAEADGCTGTAGSLPPEACLGDCTDVVCEACEGIRRALCEGGTCIARTDCPGDAIAGTSPRGFPTCIPRCTEHADCVMAADYGSCCGGCMAMHVDLVAEDPCLAESAQESSCSPAPGACDGLGCPSPPFDCATEGPDAVCMGDGTCQVGPCPSDTVDDGTRCVLTPGP